MPYALRSLLRTPVFTAVGLITLALGIGVNTAMLSVADALLRRQPPYPEPQQLVQLVAGLPAGERRLFSAVELREITARTEPFAALTSIGRTAYSLALPGQLAERIPGVAVSADFFRTFGIQPLLGRPFTVEEHAAGHSSVVVVSYGFWQERMGGAADVLGRTLRLDGELVTVVGVMPEQFGYPLLWNRSALWRPLQFTPDQVLWRDYRVFELIGRVNDGVSPAQAVASLATVASEQMQKHPESYSGARYQAVPLQEALVDETGRQTSWLLLALSGFVLLIACANLANLQLARATSNLRELAIRAALGADRARLIRHQLAESLLLSLAGGGLGLGLAWALVRVVDGQTGETYGLTLNLPVLLSAAAIALLSGILFGLLPAWLASRVDLNHALKQQGRGSAGGVGHRRARHALIVGEVALAVVLLTGAAVLQRAFVRLFDRDPGWRANEVVVAALPIPENRVGTNAERIVLFRRLEARLQAIPGVDAAAVVTSVPITSYTADRPILLEGQTPGDPFLPSAFHVMASPGYFDTVGIRLIEGQRFGPEIEAKDRAVIIINESLARRLWPNESALGRRIGSMDSGEPYWAEVVGVVSDVHAAAAVRDPGTPYQIYKPLVQEPWSYVHVVVRGARPTSLIEPLRRAIAEVDPDLAPAQVGTVRQLASGDLFNVQLAGRLLTAFAALGVLLAAIGLYGVVASVVAQRTTEFGVRLALGATAADLRRLVLSFGLRLTAYGLLIGAGGAFLLARSLSALVPRAGAPGFVPALLVFGFLLAVAVVASWGPARRATRVDPLTALRAD